MIELETIGVALPVVGNSPSEMWTAINSLALAIVALFAFLNNKKATKSRNLTAKKIDVVGGKVDDNTKSLVEVKDNLRAPLIVALKLNITLSERIAALTKDEEDIKAADEARRLFDTFFQTGTIRAVMTEPCPNCSYFPPLQSAAPDPDITKKEIPGA